MTDYEEARDEMLDRLVDDGGVDFDSDPSEFQVEGQQQANRLLRRLARLNADAEVVETVAADERQRIDDWVRDRMAGIDRGRRWLTATLEGFARANHAAGGGQSLKLPAGTLKLSKGRASVEVDEAGGELPAGLVERGLVRVAPDKAAIARELVEGPELGVTGGRRIFAAVDKTGEVVEGVVFSRPEDLTFKATPNDAEEAYPW